MSDVLLDVQILAQLLRINVISPFITKETPVNLGVPSFLFLFHVSTDSFPYISRL